MMYEIEQQEHQLSTKKKVEPREVKMIIIRNDGFDKNRYNCPTANEVAVIFVDKDGEPPIGRDFCVFSKSEDPISIPSISNTCRSNDISVNLSSRRIWLETKYEMYKRR